MKADKGLVGFTPALDVLLANYGPVTALVYGRIWRFSQGMRGLCVASLETIALGLGVNRRTVIRHIEELTAGGYLQDLTPDLKNRPHIYRTTGKAEHENINSGVTNCHTNTNKDGVTNCPNGVTQSPTGVTESHCHGDNLSLEERIEESIKKEEEMKNQSTLNSKCQKCGKSMTVSNDNAFELICSSILEKFPGADDELLGMVATDMTGNCDSWCNDCDIPFWVNKALRSYAAWFEGLKQGDHPMGAFVDEFERVTAYVG
jgi:hypothetical protein